MKAPFSRLTLVTLLAAAAPAGAQDVGRVLLATGDAVVVRGGQTVPPTFGMPVREKDVLRTGAGASLQVRFIDESVTSLRENSELRIDEFSFPGKEDGTERAVFRLLKGGLRTITGLVGRTNNRAYSMSSVVSTIGIRGTDFATTLCQQDCRNADGSLARDGQYGRVLGQSSGTNRIDVSGEVGQQRTLGINENFFQADAKSPIELLLTPPGFVGSQSPATKAAKAPAGTGKEQAASGGATQDSRRTVPATAPTVLTFAAPLAGDPASPPVAAVATAPTEQTTPAGPPTIAGLGALPTGFPFETGEGGGFFQPENMTTDPPGAASNLASTQRLLGFTLPVGFDAHSTPNSVPVSGSATTVIDETVSNPLNAHWGRWQSGSFSDEGGTRSITPNNQFHYVYGPLTPSEVVAGKTGTFNLFVVQGTTPTNNLGQLGSFSLNAATVNFTTRQLDIGSAGFNFSSSQSWSFSSPGPVPIQLVSGKGAFIDVQSVSGICSGTNCSGSAILGARGIFMGPRGDHLGVAFQAVTTSGPAASAQTAKILTCSPACP